MDTRASMLPASRRPSRFWAYVAVIVGWLLSCSGVVAAVVYLGLPLFSFGGNLLGRQLGQMAAIFLGLICGPLSLFHGLRSILKKPSRRLKLPPAYLFGVAFAVVLGLGNLLLNYQVAVGFLFPPLFLLGAALPTVAVVAWAGRRLGWPITWRQGALALVAGSTLSILLAILLEAVLPSLALVLIGPLEEVAYAIVDLMPAIGPDFLERLFYSPLVIIFLLFVAFQAPIPEELAKVLGVTFFGRKRVTDERQAFMLGLVAGAGFAILENMLYEGIYAQWSGWTWGGVTLLRGFGAVLHPICSGLVALGWFRMRKGGWVKLLRAYLAAVGLHTLWNGGFEPFVFLTGLDYYYGELGWLSIYGLGIEVLLIAFLVLLSLALWWLLRRLVTNLFAGVEPDLLPTVVSRRALAAWAFACVLLIVPIGAALGPAWRRITAVVLAGP